MQLADAQRFRLDREIGSGAIATVYRVVDDSTGAAYAGKVLHERHRRDATAAERFNREAELSRGLTHPNVVRVFGTNDVGGRRVLLMELVEGSTLAALIARESPLPQARIVALAHGIASGLAVAHAAGVIHRDLKPTNILIHGIGDGEVPKIGDFGMARATSFAGADRGAMTVLGTPHYMAPESLDPLAVDPRADLYALGCILFEMMTGDPPYSGATPLAVLERHRSAEIPPTPDRYSHGLRELVQRLLAKSPGDRPQAASAILDILASESGGTSRALVPVGGGALAHALAGRCARCSQPVIREVPMCFDCGLPQVIIERGAWSVFVLGPGKISNKVDTGLRQLLIDWVRANPTLGLDPAPLERRIPRLPFLFAHEVSESSALSLVASLQQLGFEADARVGGRFGHEQMKAKIRKLGARRAGMVAAVVCAPGLVHPALLLAGALAVLPVLPIVVATVAAFSSRPTTHVTPTAHEPLPPKVHARLVQLNDTLPTIAAKRHRQALRSVVQRVVSLVRATSPEVRAAVEAEMDHAINLAIVAGKRMDELDRNMSRPDFDPSDPEQRRDLHERDMWAGRLLDLTATLDALVSRQTAAQAALGHREIEEGLGSLRANVESLEEVWRS